mmetsp:Transcript_28725/g.46270  ORF Transcript_28725/g.46270 Transcript_28725/m.46270 type:complete len:169 (+) Transcript_28725:44-550(+)
MQRVPFSHKPHGSRSGQTADLLQLHYQSMEQRAQRCTSHLARSPGRLYGAPPGYSGTVPGSTHIVGCTFGAQARLAAHEMRCAPGGGASIFTLGANAAAKRGHLAQLSRSKESSLPQLQKVHSAPTSFESRSMEELQGVGRSALIRGITSTMPLDTLRTSPIDRDFAR